MEKAPTVWSKHQLGDKAYWLNSVEHPDDILFETDGMVTLVLFKKDNTFCLNIINKGKVVKGMMSTNFYRMIRRWHVAKRNLLRKVC